MVVKTDVCFFSENKIFPGHGSKFVRKDGRVRVNCVLVWVEGVVWSWWFSLLGVLFHIEICTLSLFLIFFFVFFVCLLLHAVVPP
jgi:hypothetical protein